MLKSAFSSRGTAGVVGQRAFRVGYRYKGIGRIPAKYREGGCTSTALALAVPAPEGMACLKGRDCKAADSPQDETNTLVSFRPGAVLAGTSEQPVGEKRSDGRLTTESHRMATQ